ncbi:MAG TPA: hypothetical protein ENG12_02855 [Candidatus Altiarchaeales archaeon]|nr:hypothetical protein [Candidatus Altiarchaeales archaeon]
MDKLNTIERVHKTNIERLVEEFGEEQMEEINKLYNTQRSSEESNAKIRDFIPIFTYRAVREILGER